MANLIDGIKDMFSDYRVPSDLLVRINIGQYREQLAKTTGDKIGAEYQLVLQNDTKGMRLSDYVWLPYPRGFTIIPTEPRPMATWPSPSDTGCADPRNLD